MMRVGWKKCNKSSRECNGEIEQNCNCRHGETSGHRSVTGEWFHGLLQYVWCILGHGDVTN